MPSLIRNRVTERDVREWLDLNGYEGKSAILESVELHAIKRPGWQQLFRFRGEVRLRSSDSHERRTSVWGVVFDDERRPRGQQTEVSLFETEADQLEELEILSVDMLTANRNRDGAGAWTLLLLGLLFVTILFVIAMAKKYLL
jgi:hypothetical protein